MTPDRRHLCACGLMFIPNGPRQTRCNACRFPVETPVDGARRYCVRCGKVFVPHAARDVYCSLPCRQARLPHDHACVHCGVVFHPTTNQRYCAVCRPLFSSRGQRQRPTQERTCAGCGQGFIPNRRDQVACSAACRQRHWYAQQPKETRAVSAESVKARLARFERVLAKHGAQEKSS